MCLADPSFGQRQQCPEYLIRLIILSPEKCLCTQARLPVSRPRIERTRVEESKIRVGVRISVLAGLQYRLGLLFSRCLGIRLVSVCFGLFALWIIYFVYFCFATKTQIQRVRRWAGKRGQKQTEPGKCCKSGILDVVSVINVDGQIKTKTGPKRKTKNKAHEIREKCLLGLNLWILYSSKSSAIPKTRPTAIAQVCL